MHKILETERLYLREFDPQDAEHMWELNTDPDVIRYTGDPPFASVQEARELIVHYPDYEKHGFGRWAVLRKSDDAWIGWCGLKRHEAGFVDIGFRFFQREWGKGYATESAEACLAYGFDTLGLSEIIGRAARANAASIRVLEKLHMTYWKTDACHGIPDADHYRMTRKQYITISTR